MKLPQVQQVLQLLLREQVSIRQLAPILEALGEAAERTTDPAALAELVRARLARVISSRYRDKQNRIYVVTLDPAIEDEIRLGVTYVDGQWSIRMPPHEVDGICHRVGEAIETLTSAGRPPIVLANSQIRAAVKQLTAAHLPRLIVLGYQEITRDTHVESVALVEGELLARRAG
jgi:flagellar biosynthesis protein FlhA